MELSPAVCFIVRRFSTTFEGPFETSLRFHMHQHRICDNVFKKKIIIIFRRITKSYYVDSDFAAERHFYDLIACFETIRNSRYARVCR
jgi:hypothetical protein